MAAADGRQKRIILWSTPRSASTAFYRAMISRRDVKGYLEPYLDTYYFSADRKSLRFVDERVRDGCTYQDRKTMLEAQHTQPIVFVKDMAHRFRQHLKKGTVDSVLPEGYIHTFLIRDPRETVPRQYNVLKRGYRQGSAGFQFVREEISYQELEAMHAHVVENLQQPSIVIDTADLLDDPEKVLKRYCEQLEIPFDPAMINWRPLTDEQLVEFEEFKDYFQTAMNSTSFMLPDSPPSMKGMPEVVKKCVVANSRFYLDLLERVGQKPDRRRRRTDSDSLYERPADGSFGDDNEPVEAKKMKEDPTVQPAPPALKDETKGSGTDDHVADAPDLVADASDFVADAPDLVEDAAQQQSPDAAQQQSPDAAQQQSSDAAASTPSIIVDAAPADSAFAPEPNLSLGNDQSSGAGSSAGSTGGLSYPSSSSSRSISPADDSETMLGATTSSSSSSSRGASPDPQSDSPSSDPSPPPPPDADQSPPEGGLTGLEDLMSRGCSIKP